MICKVSLLLLRPSHLVVATLSCDNPGLIERALDSAGVQVHEYGAAVEGTHPVHELQLYP